MTFSRRVRASKMFSYAARARRKDRATRRAHDSLLLIELLAGLQDELGQNILVVKDVGGVSEEQRQQMPGIGVHSDGPCKWFAICRGQGGFSGVLPGPW